MSRGQVRRAVVARAPQLAAVLLAAGLAATATAGCSSSGDASVANYVGGDGTITQLAADRRGAPIALSGTTVENDLLDLASLRGKTVVLNVWGSWCPPCRKEAPDLQAAYTQLAGSGVAFLGINVRESDLAGAAAFQKTFGVTYPSLVDDGGDLLLSLRGAVAAKTIPSTLILDPQGRIAARISGPTTRATLVALVQDVQSGQPGASPAPPSGQPSVQPSGQPSVQPSVQPSP